MMGCQALVVAWVLASTGCTTVLMHQKGPPVRVGVTKTASEPLRAAVATRDGAAVVVRVGDVVEVGVEREIAFSAMTVEGVHSWNPLWELLEIPMALIFVGSPSSYFWAPPTSARGGRNLEEWNTPPLMAMLSPVHGFFAMEFRSKLADGEPFEREHRRRAYLVRVPVDELAVRYRVLDAGKLVLSEGDAVTDLFGKIVFADVPAMAVGIELSAGAWSTIVAIDGAPPPEPEPEPAPIPSE